MKLRPRQRTCQLHPGMSIIEVMIATVLVAFALTGLAMLMSVNVKNSAESDYRKVAARIAQDGMEATKNLKETEDWATFIAGTNAVDNCKSNSEIRFKMTFTQSCVLTPVTGNPNAAEMKITVCWPNGTCDSTKPSIVISQTFYNY